MQKNMQAAGNKKARITKVSGLFYLVNLITKCGASKTRRCLGGSNTCL
jgi:hypothetical protein